MLASEINEHVFLENTVYCQLINLINDPLMEHEIQPQTFSILNAMCVICSEVEHICSVDRNQ